MTEADAAQQAHGAGGVESLWRNPRIKPLRLMRNPLGRRNGILMQMAIAVDCHHELARPNRD